ncbi:hypothetical protein V8F63_00135 [Brevundimonas sp. LF-1]|uniref:hypothetical protein n=1 Tax=Brevundimonas sp. LF-1 TaxID=3126100 RepID=UPI0030E39656
MIPARNPSEERLLAYAAGTLSPPEAVVVAAHLALRPANDAWVRRLQSVGGEFLEETPPRSCRTALCPEPWRGLKPTPAKSGFSRR